MKILAFVMRILTSRWTFLVLGLLAIAAIIWFGGPLLVVDGDAPLESATIRLALIAIIVLLVVLYEIFKFWRARRANKKMIEGLVDSEELVSLTEVESREELDQLKERFEEALDVLRENTVGNRRGKQFVYELPWYIIIGPPGSGKTTILRNSGLDFPLAERLGMDSVRGVGGTRNCDWWFTNEAVLIDTAGRYTTQDANVEVDRAAWRGFLDLLKTHRRRRPVNGVIVAISLSDVLTQSEGERRLHIDAVKKRLQELMRMFAVRLPVYVIFTKTDLVAGFTDFFDDLAREGREQVWGVTFPASAGNTTASVLETFPAEFDGLVQRVGDRMTQRLHAERDVKRRGTIYVFPQQLSDIRNTVAEFLNESFRGSRYDVQPIIRGVYFTSGTQEGTPIDRLMSAYSDAFHVGREQLPAYSGRGRAYFITRLLSHVIFQESDLVGTDRRLELRLAYGHMAGYALAFVMVVASLTAWAITYQRTNSRIQEIEDYVTEYQKAVEQIGNDQSLSGVLPALNALHAANDVYSGGIIRPFLSNFGLTAELSVASATQQAYHASLQKLLAPRLATQVQTQLNTDIGQQASPNVLLESLETYLMLGDPARLNPQIVRQYFAADLQNQYALNPRVRDEMLLHVNNFLQQANAPGNKIVVPLDQNTIVAARNAIETVPQTQQVIDQLKVLSRKASDIPDFTLRSALTPLALRVFTTQSGRAGRVPGFYTRSGFFGAFVPNVPHLSSMDQQGSWILGRTNPSQSGTDGVAQKVTDEYTDNYIKQWQDFLDQQLIVSFTNLSDARSTLEIMAGKNSPLNALLVEVQKNTDLSASSVATAQAPSGFPGSAALNQAASAVQHAAGALTARAAGANWPGTPIQQAFAQLNAMVDTSKGQAPPITDIQDSIAGIYSMVDKVAGAPDVPDAAFTLAVARMKPGNSDALSNLRQQAVTLPSPLRGWVNNIAANTWAVLLDLAHQHINQVYQNDVLPAYARSVARRYPVFPDSLQEATVKDFGEFFGPGGILDKFIENTLKPFLNTSGPNWTSAIVDGRSIGIQASVLQSFQLAEQIQQTFFVPGSTEVSLAFGLKPVYLDPKAARVTLKIDGQSLVYRHEPPRVVSFTWPGKDGPPGASAQIIGLNGRSKTISADGTWALFKLLNQLKLSSGSQSDLFTIKFDEVGLESSFQLQAQSTINPFDLSVISSFRLPTAL